MRNFIIHLTLVTAWDYPLQSLEQLLAAKCSKLLISNIAASGSNKTSCVFRVYHYSPSEFLLDAFADAVVKLKGFKAAMPRLLHEDGLPLTDLVSFHSLQIVYVRISPKTITGDVVFPVYETLDEMMASALGPS